MRPTFNIFVKTSLLLPAKQIPTFIKLKAYPFSLGHLANRPIHLKVLTQKYSFHPLCPVPSTPRLAVCPCVRPPRRLRQGYRRVRQLPKQKCASGGQQRDPHLLQRALHPPHVRVLQGPGGARTGSPGATTGRHADAHQPHPGGRTGRHLQGPARHRRPAEEGVGDAQLLLRGRNPEG